VALPLSADDLIGLDVIASTDTSVAQDAGVVINRNDRRGKIGGPPFGRRGSSALREPMCASFRSPFGAAQPIAPAKRLELTVCRRSFPCTGGGMFRQKKSGEDPPLFLDAIAASANRHPFFA
jgi:hypothetical protein